MLHLLDRDRDNLIHDAWMNWLKVPSLTPGDEWNQIVKRSANDEARVLKLKLFRVRGWLGAHGKAGGPLADLAKIEERYLEGRIETLTKQW